MTAYVLLRLDNGWSNVTVHVMGIYPTQGAARAEADAYVAARREQPWPGTYGVAWDEQRADGVLCGTGDGEFEIHPVTFDIAGLA